MFKNIALISLLSLALTTPVCAQSLFSSTAQPQPAVENNEAKRALHLDPEVVVEMSSGMNKSMDYEAENAKPKEVEALVKYKNFFDKERAETNNETFEEVKVNPKDPKDVRKFYNSFKPDLTSDL